MFVSWVVAGCIAGEVLGIWWTRRQPLSIRQISCLQLCLRPCLLVSFLLHIDGVLANVRQALWADHHEDASGGSHLIDTPFWAQYRVRLCL